MARPRHAHALALLVVTGCSAALPEGATGARAAGGAQQAILGGELHPHADHGFDALAENAVVIVDHVGFGDCSGTLIADRVVVTAFHCIVQDMPTWYLGDGDVEPVVSPATSFRVTLGPSRVERLCEIDVAEVHGHPQAVPVVAGNIIDNDVAVLVLTDSVLASCPVARTALLADDERGAVVVGEHVVVGGFGATNEQATLLNERRWAELSVQNANASGTNFISEDVGAGFPMPGDSGGGVFVPTSDGPVLAGISSTVVPSYLAAAKVKSFSSFIVESAGAAWSACPPEASACVDDVTRLRCADGALTAEPCADGARCASSDEGAACVARDDGEEGSEDEPDAPGCTQTQAAGSLWMLALLVVARLPRFRSRERG